MPASQFNNTLKLMDPETDRVGGLRAGPCGMGPIVAGAKIVSMQIWFQQDDGTNGSAFASGRSGAHVGRPDEDPPFEDRWRIRTGIDEESGTFTPGADAKAFGIMVVDIPGEGRRVEHWEQDVRLEAP